MANQSRLDILIAAKNQASPTIKRLSDDLRGLDRAAGMAVKGLSALGAAAGIGGLLALGDATMDLARASAESERLGDAFEQLARRSGESSDAMLAAMKRASQGTINETDLIAAANRAMMLDVASSTEQMTQLLEIAAARGKAMGLTTAQAFSDIVTGLGRGSALILDNLGIVVDLEEAHRQYAASVGKTVAQLTEQEKKQALVNQVLADSQSLLRDNASTGRDLAGEFERMNASIQNAKGALGALFAPTAAVVAQAIADAAESASESLKAMADDASRVDAAFNFEAAFQRIHSLRLELSALQSVQAQGTPEYIAKQRELNEALREYEAAQRRVNAVAIEQSGILSQLTGLRAGEAEETHYQAEAQRRSEATALAEANAMEQLRDAVERLNAARNRLIANIDSTARGIALDAAGVIGGDAALALYQDINRELNDYRKELSLVISDEKELDFLVAVRGQELRDQYRTMYDTSGAIRAQKAAVKELNQQWEELKGKVQGVLQSALDPGVGVDPDDILAKMGLRPDAINENARRLADIAKNGLKDQSWLGEFAKEVPKIWDQIRRAANPQEEAARLLSEFQDGLRPDLIDKGRAKELVKRMLIGEEKIGALAEEIAAELAAEMGISVGQAQAAARQVLGAGGQGGGVGGDAATAFDSGLSQGLATTNSGGNFISQLASQMRANFRLIQTAGEDAGRAFATGFGSGTASIPATFVQMLVDMVTPGVEAALNRRATLTGAVP